MAKGGRAISVRARSVIKGWLGDGDTDDRPDRRPFGPHDGAGFIGFKPDRLERFQKRDLVAGFTRRLTCRFYAAVLLIVSDFLDQGADLGFFGLLWGDNGRTLAGNF